MGRLHKSQSRGEAPELKGCLSPTAVRPPNLEDTTSSQATSTSPPLSPTFPGLGRETQGQRGVEAAWPAGGRGLGGIPQTWKIRPFRTRRARGRSLVSGLKVHTGCSWSSDTRGDGGWGWACRGLAPEGPGGVFPPRVVVFLLSVSRQDALSSGPQLPRHKDTGVALDRPSW